MLHFRLWVLSDTISKVKVRFPPSSLYRVELLVVRLPCLSGKKTENQDQVGSHLTYYDWV